MKRGEIWIASLEPKKGSEVGKQRPVLIIQTNLLNDVGHPTVIVAPISSKEQKENILRYKIEDKNVFNLGFGFVLIDQIRAVDAVARLKKRLGSLNQQQMRDVSLRLKQVMDLE